MLLVFDGLGMTGLLVGGCHVRGLCAVFTGVLGVYGRVTNGLIGRSKGISEEKMIPRFSSLRIITLGVASRTIKVSDRSLLFTGLRRCEVRVPGLVSHERCGSEHGVASSLYGTVQREVTSRVSKNRSCFYVSSGPMRMYHVTHSEHYYVKGGSFRGTPSVKCYTSRNVCCCKCGLRTVYKLDNIVRSFSLAGTDIRSVRCLGSIGISCDGYAIVKSGKCVDTRIRLSLFRATGVELRMPYEYGLGR